MLPLSVDLKTLLLPGHAKSSRLAANKFPPEAIRSWTWSKLDPAIGRDPVQPLSIDLYTPCVSVPA